MDSNSLFAESFLAGLKVCLTTSVSSVLIGKPGIIAGGLFGITWAYLSGKSVSGIVPYYFKKQSESLLTY